MEIVGLIMSHALILTINTFHFNFSSLPNGTDRIEIMLHRYRFY